MEKVYFVTGIDTNVGKSIATGYIANLLTKDGLRVITQKLIQTGNSNVSEDIQIHRKVMRSDLLEDDKNRKTCPYIFTYPCSPHLASQIDKESISLDKIKNCTSYLLSKYNTVLLEGAGGIMVPLTDKYLTIDFIKDNNYPVILVTSSKLGSLNHTLLTIDACITRSIKIDTIVYNDFPKSDKIISTDTYQYIVKYVADRKIKAKFLKIPYLTIL